MSVSQNLGTWGRRTMTEIEDCLSSTVKPCFKNSKRGRSKEAFERGPGNAAWCTGLVYHMRTQLPCSALKMHISREKRCGNVQEESVWAYELFYRDSRHSLSLQCQSHFSECLKWNSFRWTLCLGEFCLLKGTIVTSVVVKHLKYILRVSPSAKHGLSGGVSP